MNRNSKSSSACQEGATSWLRGLVHALALPCFRRLRVCLSAMAVWHAAQPSMLPYLNRAGQGALGGRAGKGKGWRLNWIREGGASWWDGNLQRRRTARREGRLLQEHRVQERSFPRIPAAAWPSVTPAFWQQRQCAGQ